MTVFGTTLDGAQIAALIGLLATLVIWIFALRDANGYRRWFRGWSNAKKTDSVPGDDPPSRKTTGAGPWG